VASRAPDAVLAAWAGLAGEAGAAATAPLLGSLLADAGRAGDLREAALRALLSLDPPELQAHVDAALADADPGLRAVALEVLQQLDPALALPRLPAVLEQGGFAEQRVALAILAEAPSADAAARLSDWLARLDAGLAPVELALDVVLAAEAVAAHAPAPDASGVDAADVPAPPWAAGPRARLAAHAARGAEDPFLGPWLDTLFGGDRVAGEELFKRPSLSCQRCHGAWEGAAPSVGPNLFGVGARLARVQLLEAVVDPNRRTSPGYAGHHLVLRDATTLSGRILAEDAEGVRLQDAEGREHALPVAEIARRRTGLSAMPEGLAAGLTRTEMRDLIAYLASL
jgi:quinoprotein glucose dehydrogenase